MVEAVVDVGSLSLSLIVFNDKNNLPFIFFKLCPTTTLSD